MIDYKRILLTIGIIISSNVLGHFFPPSSIFLTPVIVGTGTYLLATASLKLSSRLTLIILAVIANDILVKLYAGGNHDFEGAGWVNFFFVCGVVIVTITAIATSGEASVKKNAAYLIIPVALISYISYFAFFGLSYTKPESESQEISKTEGLFLGELRFSDKQISFKGDSLLLLNGWVERQQITDHKGIIKRNVPGKEVNYIIKVKSNKPPYGTKLSYKVNSGEINFTGSVDSVIKFSVTETVPSIFFFSKTSQVADSVIKEIKIDIQ